MENLPYMILILAGPIALAQPPRATLFLKDGTSEDHAIREVHTWGVSFAEPLTAMFRVLDSMRTESRVLAVQIMEVLPSANLDSAAGVYSISFVHANIARSESPEPTVPVVMKSISGFLSSSEIGRVGVQLDYLLWFFRYALGRLETSFGFYGGVLPFASMNYSFGFGVNSESENYRGTILLNFGEFAGHSEPASGRERQQVGFVSFTFHVKMGSANEFFSMAGIQPYFSRIVINGFGTEGALMLGVGLAL